MHTNSRCTHQEEKEEIVENVGWGWRYGEEDENVKCIRMRRTEGRRRSCWKKKFNIFQCIELMGFIPTTPMTMRRQQREGWSDRRRVEFECLIYIWKFWLLAGRRGGAMRTVFSFIFCEWKCTRLQKLHSMGCIMSQCVSGMYSCECICQPYVHTLLLLLLQLHTKLLWKGVITLGRIIWINYFEKHRFSCSGNMYFEISLLLDFHGRQRRLNAQHNP